MHRKAFGGLLVLSALGLIFVVWAVWVSGVFHSSTQKVATVTQAKVSVKPDSRPIDPVIARGRYLARAGDCVACHTTPGGQTYAGGLAMDTPFGTIYTPNITPDRKHGIGSWTEEDFWRAMHNGISPGNKLLYPVFPFVSFSRVSRPDVDAIFAYLQSLPPVAQPNRPNKMTFPFNQRAMLVFWRALFFRPGEFKPVPGKSAEWNRGAYLVEGLGHCSMCHTSFNALGATIQDADFAGGLIPIQNWYAPALNASKEQGLGNWSEDDIVQFLKTGTSPRGAVYGPMADVVFHSLQYLDAADLKSIAMFLRAQPVLASPTDQPKFDVTEVYASGLFKRGRQIYNNDCAECHQKNGEGVGSTYPPLAGNPSIVAQPGINAIRMVLLGGFQPGTAANPRPYSMPSFSQTLNDEDVAAVVTYIRQAWGNKASAVSPVDVTPLRPVPAQ